MKPHVIIYGPPGSGKDTLADHLSSHFDIQRLSAGDLLRDEIRRNTELGISIRPYVERGDLIPGTVVTDLMRAHVSQAEQTNTGYILVGYPRTPGSLDELLTASQPTHVIHLDVKKETAWERSRHRKRHDDVRDAFKHRWSWYIDQEVAAIDHARELNLNVQRIDGSEDENTVAQEAINFLQQ